MNRRELVRMAGVAGSRKALLLGLRLGMDRAYRAFGAAMSSHLWGPPKPLPTRKVSVPRSLRHRLGRYIEVTHWPKSGRKRKDRRKHNRRWMPEQGDQCAC